MDKMLARECANLNLILYGFNNSRGGQTWSQYRALRTHRICALALNVENSIYYPSKFKKNFKSVFCIVHINLILIQRISNKISRRSTKDKLLIIFFCAQWKFGFVVADSYYQE